MQTSAYAFTKVYLLPRPHSLIIHVHLVRKGICSSLASSPGRKRRPGTHCLHMRRIVPEFQVYRLFYVNLLVN